MQKQKETTKDTKLKRLVLEKKPKAHLYDRDKNPVYYANDESMIEVVDDEGHRYFTHPNREQKAH